MKKDTANSKKTESRAVANADHSAKKKANANLPEDLQTKLEASFGQDFSDVALQKNSNEAREMNALAFTRSEKIHFAPGQFNPNTEKGRNLIGHEFTHIAQQRSGVVRPTRVLRKRFTVNDDRGLESDADQLGKKAARGEIISKYQSASLGMRNSMRTVQAKSSVIQRAVSTWGGKWDTDQYDLRKDEAGGTKYPAASGVRGVDIKLKFTPGKNADATLIGLTQSVQGIVNNKVKLTKGAALRDIEAKDAISIGNGETDEGTAIDQAEYNRNPLYAVEKASKKDVNLYDTAAGATWGQHGWHNSKMKPPKKDATLSDKPTRSRAAKDSRHIFETTALAIKGVQAGTYYGSVRWGWRTDSKGKFTKIPLQAVSQGTPSSTFMKAAEIWNASKTSKGESTLNLPVEDVQLISNGMGVNIGLGPLFTHLPFGTRVVILPVFTSMVSSMIKVVDGPHIGETGEVQNSDLSDERS